MNMGNIFPSIFLREYADWRVAQLGKCARATTRQAAGGLRYDDKPDFEYTPSKEQYIEELKKYPRKNTPNWLNKIVN